MHSAKNLNKKDFFSKLLLSIIVLSQAHLHLLASWLILNIYIITELPDPFAKITVDGSGQCHSTEIVKGTLDPKWNQHYDL